MGQGKRRLGRVDLQVSLLAAALVAVSVLCMYFYQYTLAHGDMLRSLENKVQGIYEYVESIAEEEDFTAINRREDEAGAQYRGLKEELERVRKIAGVRYLYTAKQAQDGGFVYLVDGLDSGAEDFRHAGDPIEEEIYPQMRRRWPGRRCCPTISWSPPGGTCSSAITPCTPRTAGWWGCWGWRSTPPTSTTLST